MKPIVHDALAVEYDVGAWRPQLAVATPSLEAGTWRLLPDGRMETLWTLRPNILWHDGAALTTADLLFTFTVFKDPGIPSAAAGRPLMESAEALDHQTLIIRWRQTFVDAHQGGIGAILPRHRLEEPYHGDREAFLASPLHTTEFVGLGPYRLTRWERGVELEAVRFDSYYQGRPPLDRVIVRFIGDPNTMVANALSGAVDVVLPTGGTGDIDAALEVKRQWEGTGNQVRVDLKPQFEQLEIQHRPDYARPVNGLTNRLVRQAFYHAIDRPTLAEVMTHGLGFVADSWISPTNPLRREVEASIPSFPYNLGRARDLLAEAGWVRPDASGRPDLSGRGPDGVLVHSTSGERFDIEIRANQGPGSEREISAIADGWKAIGAQVSLVTIPPARQGDREYESTRPGVFVTSPSAERMWIDRLHTNQITTAANRWTGRNRGGYVNPRVDALLDALNAAIDPRQRIALHRELLQEQMGDVALFPLYWEVSPVLMLKGVRGPKVVRNEVTANIFEWDRD